MAHVAETEGRRVKNTLLARFCFILASTPFAAPGGQSGDFTYATDGSAITITGYTGTNGEATIPATIAGLPVTSIGYGAFAYHGLLTNVTIPSTTTNIGASAFYDTGLASVTIPDSVTYIGDYAFQNSLLESVAISGSAINFGSGVFDSCFRLTSVTIPNSITNLGVRMFNGCSRLASITIPESLTSIAAGMFSGCSGLTNITIPNGVTTIGDYAFSGCSRVTRITIPPSVTRLGNYAFAGCSSVVSITIPENITTIGAGTFSGCSGLTNITIPGSVRTIGDDAFYYCTSLTNVTIPASVNRIGSEAFLQCSNLATVTIPGSVTNIGVNAFYFCTSLTAITVDSANISYTSLDGVLFTKNLSTLIQCPGGKTGSFLIPDGVIKIRASAFAYCTRLTSVTIPSSLTDIGANAFYFCTSLTAFTVDPANPSYSSLDGILFDKSLRTLIQYPGVKAGNYLIPSSVYDIGNAFNNCTRLTSVTIPSSVTHFGYLAFCNSPSLGSVFLKGNRPATSNPIFDASNNAIVYYLPGAAGWNPTFDGHPARLWNPVIQTGPGLGVSADGFGFNITGTADIPIVIEASTNLANDSWVALQSLNLTNGAISFTDPSWTNYPSRLYRIRLP